MEPQISMSTLNTLDRRERTAAKRGADRDGGLDHRASNIFFLFGGHIFQEHLTLRTHCWGPSQGLGRGALKHKLYCSPSKSPLLMSSLSRCSRTWPRNLDSLLCQGTFCAVPQCAPYPDVGTFVSLLLRRVNQSREVLLSSPSAFSMYPGWPAAS